jgi:hypothetical protein
MRQDFDPRPHIHPRTLRTAIIVAGATIAIIVAVCVVAGWL